MKFGLLIVGLIWIALLLVACGGSPVTLTQPTTEAPPSPSPTLTGVLIRVGDGLSPPVAAAARAQPMTVLLAPSKDKTLYEVEEGFLSNGSVSASLRARAPP